VGGAHWPDDYEKKREKTSLQTEGLKIPEKGKGKEKRRLAFFPLTILPNYASQEKLEGGALKCMVTATRAGGFRIGIRELLVRYYFTFNIGNPRAGSKGGMKNSVASRKNV